MLSQLRRVGDREACEARPDVVNDEKIAIGSVVVAEPETRADRLVRRRVQLHQVAQSQETRKRVIRLEAGEVNREVALRHSKAVPSLGPRKREPRVGPVIEPHTRLIQSPVVICTEALEKVVSEFLVLTRAEGKLVPRKMVKAGRNHNVLVDVKRTGDQLSEDVHDVVVGVSTIVELGAECGLPLLSLKHLRGVRRMIDKPFKIQLSHAGQFRPRLQG